MSSLVHIGKYDFISTIDYTMTDYYVVKFISDTDKLQDEKTTD